MLQVKNLRDFDRFMRLAAVRTSQLLSFNSFASDIGVSPNTIKNWISVLEASNVIYVLEPYYRNLGKRLVKTPKLYFLDTGLACYLAGLRSIKDLRHSGLMGALFETHVVSQAVRRLSNQSRKASLYFYRDHHGHEVDLVIPVGEKLKLMECKWSESPPPRVKGFEEISRLIGDENVISRSIITPVRGTHRIAGKQITMADSVELQGLDD